MIIDYINRFWLIDIQARIQLFDFKTTYQFQTTPGISHYNMPLYSFQNGEDISYYPVYQGFLMPARVNGVNCPLYSDTGSYYDMWPNYIQQMTNIAVGDGGSEYTINTSFRPLIPGHLDVTGLINATPSGNIIQDPILVDTLIGNTPNDPFSRANVTVGVTLSATLENGQNIVVTDTGQFLSDNTDSDLYGLLYSPSGISTSPGSYPYGNIYLQNPTPLVLPNYSITSNTVNYNTGVIHVNFPATIPVGTPINVGVYEIEQGVPRAIMFSNNTLTMRPPPYTQYLVELTAYLTPAAFLTTNPSIQFAYMCEYIARGAARKILSDTGDIEQFMFYEPLFKEQETLVWKRSQRQFTSTRTETIYSNSGFQSNFNQGSGN